MGSVYEVRNAFIDDNLEKVSRTRCMNDRCSLQFQQRAPLAVELATQV